MRRRSLRFRLVATVAALMAGGLVLFGAGTYYALQRNLLGQADSQLDRTGEVGELYIDAVPKEKGLPRFGDDEEDGSATEPLAENIAIPVFLQTRGPDNKVIEELVREGSRPDIPAVLPFDGERVVHFTVSDSDEERHWRVRAARLHDGRGYLLIAQEVRWYRRDARRDGPEPVRRRALGARRHHGAGLVAGPTRAAAAGPDR